MDTKRVTRTRHKLVKYGICLTECFSNQNQHTNIIIFRWDTSNYHTDLSAAVLSTSSVVFYVSCLWIPKFPPKFLDFPRTGIVASQWQGMEKRILGRKWPNANDMEGFGVFVVSSGFRKQTSYLFLLQYKDLNFIRLYFLKKFKFKLLLSQTAIFNMKNECKAGGFF